MTSQLHPLAGRYLDAIYELPDELRARRDLDDELAAHMTGGLQLCIRGFWRIGKTTLMRGVLQRACERTGGAAFVLDLRDPEREDGAPPSVEVVLQRVAAKVDEFLGRVGAAGLKAEVQRPLQVLGELAAPLFVGFDELIALTPLGAEGMARVIDALLDVPKNVKVVLVCHRHRDADALFEEKVVSRPAISDEELVTLVQTPANALGVSFENEALGALAEISGNRPWELFSLCAVLASRLPPDFKGAITPAQCDELVNLDLLGESDEGRALLDHHLRVLVTAMSAEERTVVELLSAGKEGEASEAAIAQLEAAGFVVATDAGYAVNGALFEFVSRGLVEGAISVSVE